jgi:peptidoglycan hydrolase-like protein with peptidoglycan-binding domain
MAFRFLVLVAVVVVGLPASASARGDADVAALQVGLRRIGMYAATVDGIAGPVTFWGVRALQSRTGVVVRRPTGAGARGALGAYGAHGLGSRHLHRGARGWDVAALQFLLAWRGFPSGSFDGVFGERVEAALRRYQRWARIAPDGIAGPATLRRLRAPPAGSPLALSRPLSVRSGDGFGPRGDRFHTGLDYPAATGTAVAAARSGRVVFAGWLAGGWGNLVTLAHGHGVRTMYAHLSTVELRLGQRISAGTRIGRVGSTGAATGSHLHFEVRLRGAAINPVSGFR